VTSGTCVDRHPVPGPPAFSDKYRFTDKFHHQPLLDPTERTNAP
jgi:hypothetical protein